MPKTPPACSPRTYTLHRWAAALNSSQAFAHNIFSGAKRREFEFGMRALVRDKLHWARMDVALESADGALDLYEVKMFEFLTSAGKNQIFHTEEQAKYLRAECYECSTPAVADAFIGLIQNIRDEFKDERVYGGGVKQICCHLLGITNEMLAENGRLRLGGYKRVRFHCLCFDHDFGCVAFVRALENYKRVLGRLKPLADGYLEEVGVGGEVEFCGFVGAKEFVEDGEGILGVENCGYVGRRYF